MLNLVISLINALTAIIGLIAALISITKETSFLQNKKERGMTTNNSVLVTINISQTNIEQVIIIEK